MWGVFKKGLPIFTLYIIPSMSLFVLWQLNKSYLNVSRVLILGYFIILFTSGAVTSSEQNASNNKEYQFLQYLPIKDSEIVMAKFLLAFISVLFCLSISLILLRVLDTTELNLVLTYFYLVICASLSLIISAIWYVLIFKYGIFKVFKIIWVVLTICFISPILIDILLISKNKVNSIFLCNFIEKTPWFLWFISLIAVIFIYLQLMNLAINIKSEGLKGFE